jgi:hypothetical protein
LRKADRSKLARDFEESLARYKEDEGKRIRLVSTCTQDTTVKAGDEGIITFVDGNGTRYVQWDKGGSLSLVPVLDEWEFI